MLFYLIGASVVCGVIYIRSDYSCTATPVRDAFGRIPNAEPPFVQPLWVIKEEEEI